MSMDILVMYTYIGYIQYIQTKQDNFISTLYENIHYVFSKWMNINFAIINMN